jgi:hypothetical protein
MRAPVGVVLKLPQMDDLVNRPGVCLEIADEALIVPSLTQRREAKVKPSAASPPVSTSRTMPLAHNGTYSA